PAVSGCGSDLAPALRVVAGRPRVVVDDGLPGVSAEGHPIAGLVGVMRASRLSPLRDGLLARTGVRHGLLAPPRDARLPDVRRRSRYPGSPVMRHRRPGWVRVMRARGLDPLVPIGAPDCPRIPFRQLLSLGGGGLHRLSVL